MKLNKVDIMLLQEHNIREADNICSELNDQYDIILNLSIAHKGGTAIVIDKRIDFRINSYEMSADSRIISAFLEVYNKPLHLINIYAPSGSNNSERDHFFSEDLIFYLRNNIDNTVIGGDFNCITSSRDSTSENTHICKALKDTFNSINMKDAWFTHNRDIEYTYFRDNYGSRLDRFYVKKLSNDVKDIKVKHINFSDHSCIQMDVSLSNVHKSGKYYWKMNITLLDNARIKELFSKEWMRLKIFLSRYKDINEWWELCAKKGIKSFFIKQGRIENQKKFGLLKYLECSLNRLLNKNSIENRIDFERVKCLKSRITDIKNDILEGVKVRSRIEEQLEGEKVSSFLIKKQSEIKKRQYITKIKSEPNIIKSLEEGVILDNSDIIELYIYKYYEKLYKEEPFNQSMQNKFLDLISKKLNDHDREELDDEITDKEIYRAVMNLNTNKSPGIDGIPIEFYQKYWGIVKHEIVQIIKNISKGTLLSHHQKQAIITLIPKGGDLELLKSWRPISLICCDTKIVAKILANRIKPLMSKIISSNQFCIPGNTITKCNTERRDILYYYGENDSTGAIINLDWEKAFDRVSWTFLTNIMKRMGFSDFIIKWLVTLYSNIQSICMINGRLTNPFDVKRGVRQGCPMSMICYVIFQEPLYLAIQISIKIIPPLLPAKQTKCLGFADDTSIIVRDDTGFIESFEIIKEFELASNSKLNPNKTKVYGFGVWKDRVIWPIANLKIERDFFVSLGIVFSCNYDVAINNTWLRISNKIRNRIAIIRGNFYTIYQKSIIINSLILSKVWYAAHVYPLPNDYSKVIINEIFSFIWKRNYNPISRNILYNHKLKGGIGLIDLFLKAKSIYTATIIKNFADSKKCDLIQYYLALRLNAMFGIERLPSIFCYTTTPYYEQSLDLIRKCHKLRDFPNIRSKDIYSIILPYTQPNIEKLYLNFNWRNIWKNLNFKYINIYDRHILYKYIHEVLPNNKRLYNIGSKMSPNCENCGIEETNIHMFLYCSRVQGCIRVMYKILFYFCNLDFKDNLLKLMFLEFPRIDRKIQNTLCIIISSYISCIWYNREDANFLIYKLKAKIIREQKYHKLMLKDRMHNLFTENYININPDILNHL